MVIAPPRTPILVGDTLDTSGSVEDMLGPGEHPVVATGFRRKVDHYNLPKMTPRQESHFTVLRAIPPLEVGGRQVVVGDQGDTTYIIC